jgi:predicted Rossmann-fold nucleotide-binding protein
LLGELGADVLTGGYGGLMAAVSRGAHDAGAHVVGLAMSGWTHLDPNAWNTEVQWSDDYPARLGKLLGTDCVLALDGGVGTLSELAVVWAAAQTEPGAPLIVALGERWERLLPALRRELVVDDDDVALVHLARTPQRAVDLIRAARPAPTQPPQARG